MLHGHGGNISAVARRFGLKPSEIIDMSSNINPLGPPEGLMDFLKDNLKLRSFALQAISVSETASDGRTPPERQVA